MRKCSYVCNGVEYTTGVGIEIKRNAYDSVYTNGWFRFYDDENDYVTYDIRSPDHFLMQTWSVPAKDFATRVGGTNGKFNPEIHIPYKVRLKDSQIDKLVIGWIIYIAVMIGSMIFKGFISVWIFGSIFFYFWRKDVIKKEGYYVNW